MQNISNIQLLTNTQISASGARAGRADVLDLLSGERYSIFWGGPPQTHTDFSPLAPEDTAKMKRISGGWNWLPRPVVLILRDDLMLAAGVHHFPHGSIIGGRPGLPNNSNTPPPRGTPWPIGGHMCMYFKDSTGGTRGMTEAAAEAYRLAQEAEDMTQERFNTMMNVWLQHQSTLEANPNIAPDEFNIAIQKGITDGTRPQGFATRQEVAIMALRAKNAV